MGPLDPLNRWNPLNPLNLLNLFARLTWVDHVRDPVGDVAHPLLPQVPVGLVDGTHVSTLGTTLVCDLTLWEGRVVLDGNCTGSGEGSRGPVVADGPVARTWEDAGVPVISVGDVAAVPRKGDAIVDGLEELLVGAASVGVPHVVEHGDGERFLVASWSGGGEAQDARGCRAVPAGDLVVVGLSRLEAGDLHLVEELAALGDGGKGGAWRGAVVPALVFSRVRPPRPPHLLHPLRPLSPPRTPRESHSRRGVALGEVVELLGVLAPLDAWVRPDAEGGLEMDVDTGRDVCEGDDVDVVGGVSARGLDSRRLLQTREALSVAIDGLVDPVTDGDGWTGVGVSGVDGGEGADDGCQTRSGGDGAERGVGLHGGQSRGGGADRSRRSAAQ